MLHFFKIKLTKDVLRDVGTIHEMGGAHAFRGTAKEICNNPVFAALTSSLVV